MKIAVYGIARNEEKNVEQWFKSSKDADFHLILDTGSTDKTIAIAKELGITVHESFFSPWNESMAKNVAMSLLPKDIDVCICLDLDQRIDTKNWKNILLESLYEKPYNILEHDFIDKVDIFNKKLNRVSAKSIHSRKNCYWHKYRPSITTIIPDNAVPIFYVPITISHTKGNEERYVDRESIYLDSWEVEYQKVMLMLDNNSKEATTRYLLEIVVNQAFNFFEINMFDEFFKKEQEYNKLKKDHIEYIHELNNLEDMLIINTFDSQFMFIKSLIYPEKAEVYLKNINKQSLYFFNAQLKLDVINFWKNGLISENIKNLTDFDKFTIYADSKTGRHKVELAKKAYKYFTGKESGFVY